ncbi:MAG: glutaredoxin 3 [Pseudomonadota bacterium]
MSKSVTMYTTRLCPYCIRARHLLDAKNVPYEDIAVDGKPELRRRMTELSGQRTVPQIWIGEHHVGGYTDLFQLEQLGQLDELLGAPGAS